VQRYRLADEAGDEGAASLLLRIIIAVCLFHIEKKT